jgi:hypothetical protein
VAISALLKFHAIIRRQ